jgi:Regulator of ribonuclease activity B
MYRKLFLLCKAIVLSVVPGMSSTAISNDFEQNEKVREALRGEADDGRTARVVRHYAYFQTCEARDTYRAFLLAHGYQVDRDSHQDQYPNPWGIVFSKVQVPNDIDGETEKLRANAARFGGEYDGWETGIVYGP